MLESTAMVPLWGLFCTECSMENLSLTETVHVVRGDPSKDEVNDVHLGDSRFRNHSVLHARLPKRWSIRCWCGAEWFFPQSREDDACRSDSLLALQ